MTKCSYSWKAGGADEGRGVEAPSVAAVDEGSGSGEAVREKKNEGGAGGGVDAGGGGGGGR